MFILQNTATVDPNHPFYKVLSSPMLENKVRGIIEKELPVLKLDSLLPEVIVAFNPPLRTPKQIPIRSSWSFKLTNVETKIGVAVWDAIVLDTLCFQNICTRLTDETPPTHDDLTNGVAFNNKKVEDILSILVLSQALIAHNVKYSLHRMHGTKEATFEKDMLFVKARAYTLQAFEQLQTYVSNKSQFDDTYKETLKEIIEFYQ